MVPLIVRFLAEEAKMSQEQQEIDRLCTAILQEKDTARLTKLVEQLNEALEVRDRKRPAPSAAKAVQKADASGT
jgi:hypothetical protein